MKPNKEYLAIDIPIFNDVILYIVGDIGECIRDFLETEYKDKNTFKKIDTTLNIAYSNETKQCLAFTSRPIVNLPEEKKAGLVFIKAYDNSERDTIIHESIHAAWSLLDKKGIEVSFDNDEILCYLVGFITEQIWQYRGKRQKYLEILESRKQ